MPILYESLYERLSVGPVLTNQFLSMRTGESGWRESVSFSREGRYIKIAMTYPHQNHIMHEFEFYRAGIGWTGWTKPVGIHSVCGEFAGSPPDYLDVRTAGKSIDGNPGSWWQCNENHVGWIVFDLGSTKTVTRVRVYQGQYMDSCDVYVGDNPAEFIPPKPLIPSALPIALAAGVIIVGGVIYWKRRKK